MFPYYISSLLTVITCLSLGVFILYKNPRSSTHQSLCLLNLSVALWSLLLFLHYHSKDYNSALLSVRLLHIGAVFIPSCYFYFICNLLGITKAKKGLLRLCWFLSLLFLGLSFTKYFIRDVSPKLNFVYYGDAGPLYILWIIIYTAIIAYSLVLLLKEIKVASSSKKNQIKYVLFASIIGFAGAATVYPLWYNIPILPFGEHVVFLYPIIIALAVLKHKLLDIEIVIRKTLVYSLLAGFITVIFLLMVLFTERLFKNIMGYQSFLATVTAAIIIAIMFTPVKNRIQLLVDKIYLGGTHAQMQKEFQKFKDELEQSDKMKAVATLAAGMAHEIRNPLTAIKTFTEYLPEKFNDKSFRENFTRIVGSEVERINSIVGQLLEFAKPKPMNFQKVNIHNLLNDTILLLSEQLIKNKITLNKYYADSILLVHAEPDKLRHVFFNIFKNAIEAMKGPGALTITTRLNEKIIVEIRDTGCGMTQEQIARACDPFFSTKENGTGLGLSICHSIMKEHKASMEIKSLPAVGTSVILHFA
ncbi:MAG: ATP-binding protein [Candidatus Omnitrophota bacterium]